MKTTPQFNWEDKDHRILEKAKEKHGGTWKEFILDLSKRFLEEGE